MQYKLRNNGFSLTEVMMAAGILAIGFAFIAGMFPVGVKLTAITTEQTIAPIVVDEAIAKMKLYGDPNFVEALRQADLLSPTEYINFSDVCYIPDYEFIYPSIYPSAEISLERSRYHWSALCRPDMFSNEVHVIVFVSRRAGAGANYVYYVQYGGLQTDGIWPVPVMVAVEVSENERRLTIDAGLPQRSYISTGSTIIDDATGRVYRVLERIYDDAADEIVIVLDRDWEGPVSGFVWVVPPAVGSGRYPCVRVDPTHTIRF